MTREDLRIFCTALGFMAVVTKDDPTPNAAERARKMALLIEAFCLETMPEAFTPALEDFSAEEQATGT